jgi:hypothetical protein
MCDLSKDFKLCTCIDDNVSQDEIDWTLMRKNKKLQIQHKRGRAAIPKFSAKENFLKKDILTLLNKENAFDFDYKGEEDDFLRLRIDKANNRWVAFRFVAGGWTNDTSTSLSSWRSQLVALDKGKLKS